MTEAVCSCGHVASSHGVWDGCRKCGCQEMPAKTYITPLGEPSKTPSVGDLLFIKERRERIATAVLQGLAANPNNVGEFEAVSTATEWADLLIARLDADK